MSKMDRDKYSGSFRIVGRPDLDLSKYLVAVNGRMIINYEKLKLDDPLLYGEILQAEHDANVRNDSKLKKLLEES